MSSEISFTENNPNSLSEKREKGTLCILTNDISTFAAKTSAFIASAAKRCGWLAFVRDTYEIRLCTKYLSPEINSVLFEMGENAMSFKFDNIMRDFGATRVLSLDLHWLFGSRAFLKADFVESIDSIWFDDLRTASITYPIFPMKDPTFQEALKHEKVHHFFYGQGQIEEATLLGLNKKYRTMLAAPREYLDAQNTCEIFDRAAFIGNPGLSTPPTVEAKKRMEEGADLVELRKLARTHLWQEVWVNSKPQLWINAEPTVRDFLDSTFSAKIENPDMPALRLLTEIGKNFERAFTYINERGEILDAAFLVKAIRRYDRPALVHRLYSKGLLDVYSAPEEWAAYGVKAKPLVRFPDLPRVYQKYLFHLNAPNCAREAAANEKLFEIAACGRVSLNIDSPDLHIAYQPPEIELVKSLDEAEEKARLFIQQPDELLKRGELARKKTAEQHLWDHRFQQWEVHHGQT